MPTTLRYRLFGKHTGLRVSELVLGTANFGQAWGGHGADRDEARRILDTYADADRFFSFRRATHRGEADYGRQVSLIGVPGSSA